MTEPTTAGPAAADAVGREMHALVERLYPLCRSITGDGVRRTLEIVGESVPLRIHEVPTGTEVLDWTVPKEWNIRDAYIKDPSGARVVDFAESNLHVVGYSVPVAATMPLTELRRHLHTLPEQPDLIPYRTSYYAETWGFCLRENTLAGLPDGDYEVRIDSTLADGHLTYGEHVVPGRVTDEVLISCHVCHPRWPTTIWRASPWRPGSPSGWPGPTRGTPTASCSCRAPSARSPGWRVTANAPPGSGTGSCWPARGTAAR